MSNRPVEPCRACGYKPKDWPDLAHHIITQKVTHPKSSIRWALAFAANSDYLDQKVSQQKRFEGGRLPITEEIRQAKEESQRPLSGIEKSVMCVCPTPKCHRTFPSRLPVEFITSGTAWKIGNNFAVTCDYCKK